MKADNKQDINNAAANSAMSYSRINVNEDVEESIDIKEVFYLFLDHIFQIVLVLLIGAVVAFCYTKFLVTPMYTSTAQLYIVSATNDSVVNLADLQIGSQLTGDYKKLMKIHPLIEEVNSNLDLNMSYEHLAGMISVDNPDNTRLLNITVVSPDPQMSADIANEVARLSIIYLPEIMECKTPHIADWALVPKGPSSPSYAKNTVIGAMAFVVVYCGFLLVRMLTNDTFVTQEDVEKFLGDPPIGVIPEGQNESSKRRKLSDSKSKDDKNGGKK